LDESTDITGRAQLLAISRIVCNGAIIEQFLFCRPLPETTKGQDILGVVDSYFSCHDLSWKPWINICTDGPPSVSRSLKGFVALAKRNNIGIVFAHCFLHREALISKSAVPEVQKVMHETINSRPLQSRLFSALCSVMVAAHTTPTAHGSNVAISGAGASKVL
jgi:hypothetical protein